MVSPDPNLMGVINGDQQLKLCQRFNIRQEDLIPVFSGWYKRVLLTKDLAFLFPRDPDALVELDREIEIYKAFAQMNFPKVPQLVEVIEDKEIYFLKIAVVKRLPGKVFSEILPTLTTEQLYDYLDQLVDLLVDLLVAWHTIPAAKWPPVFHQTQKVLSLDNVLNQLMDEDGSQVLTELVKRVNSYLGNEEIDQALHTWLTASLDKLRVLDHVLVHGDLQEGQLLVQQGKITGILDWQSVSIRNPVYEFDFLEWGLDIWSWREQMPEIRQRMWKRYIGARGLELPDYLLHLFYLIAELDVILSQQEKDIVFITQSGPRESLLSHIGQMRKLYEEHHSQ